MIPLQKVDISSLRGAKRRSNPEMVYESIIITAFQRMDYHATLAKTAYFANNGVIAIESSISIGG